MSNFSPFVILKHRRKKKKQQQTNKLIFAYLRLPTCFWSLLLQCKFAAVLSTRGLVTIRVVKGRVFLPSLFPFSLFSLLFLLSPPFSHPPSPFSPSPFSLIPLFYPLPFLRCTFLLPLAPLRPRPVKPNQIVHWGCPPWPDQNRENILKTSIFIHIFTYFSFTTLITK